MTSAPIAALGDIFGGELSDHLARAAAPSQRCRISLRLVGAKHAFRSQDHQRCRVSSNRSLACSGTPAAGFADADVRLAAIAGGGGP